MKTHFTSRELAKLLYYRVVNAMHKDRMPTLNLNNSFIANKYAVTYKELNFLKEGHLPFDELDLIPFIEKYGLEVRMIDSNLFHVQTI